MVNFDMPPAESGPQKEGVMNMVAERLQSSTERIRAALGKKIIALRIKSFERNAALFSVILIVLPLLAMNTVDVSAFNPDIFNVGGQDANFENIFNAGDLNVDSASGNIDPTQGDSGTSRGSWQITDEAKAMAEEIFGLQGDAPISNAAAASAVTVEPGKASGLPFVEGSGPLPSEPSNPLVQGTPTVPSEVAGMAVPSATAGEMLKTFDFNPAGVGEKPGEKIPDIIDRLQQENSRGEFPDIGALQEKTRETGGASLSSIPEGGLKAVEVGTIPEGGLETVKTSTIEKDLEVVELGSKKGDTGGVDSASKVLGNTKKPETIELSKGK